MPDPREILLADRIVGLLLFRLYPRSSSPSIRLSSTQDECASIEPTLVT
jgi:hypothetical protein